MNLAIALASLSLTLLADDSKTATPPDPIGQMRESKEYKAAYAKAHADAEKAIKAGRAAFFAFGLRRTAENLDQQTGLPIEAIAGCVVNDEILGRAAGNNDCINEYVTKNGPPANSMKKWEKELFDLKGYVAAQKKLQPPHRLVVGGPIAKSPDGKYAIRPLPSHLKKEDGTPLDLLGYVLTSNGKNSPQHEFFWTDSRSADLIWGPEGSGFLVLVGKLEGTEIYMAIDARSGSTLRSESVTSDQAKPAF